MRRIIIFLLLASPAFGQDPKPTPAPVPDAKAIISLPDGQPVPKQWPLGMPIDLSSKSSVAGDKEKSVQWVISDPFIDKYSIRRDNGRTLSVGSGINPIKVTVTLYVAKDDTFDRTFAEIEFVNGQDPAPKPTPDPGPDPGPRPPPPDPVYPPYSSQAIGQQYAKDLKAAAVAAVKAAADSNATDPQGVISASSATFNAGLKRAVAPMEMDLINRFGSATSGNFDPARLPAVKTYFRGMAEGMLGGGDQ